MFTLSQNAQAVLSATVSKLSPIDIHLSSLAEDRTSLKKIIERAGARGGIPFEHVRLEEIMVRYNNGTLVAPGPGSWVLVTDRWQDGVFTLEFCLPPPVPQLPVLVSVNYSDEVKQPFGLKHKFLFNQGK